MADARGEPSEAAGAEAAGLVDELSAALSQLEALLASMRQSLAAAAPQGAVVAAATSITTSVAHTSSRNGSPLLRATTPSPYYSAQDGAQRIQVQYSLSSWKSMNRSQDGPRSDQTTATQSVSPYRSARAKDGQRTGSITPMDPLLSRHAGVAALISTQPRDFLDLAPGAVPEALTLEEVAEAAVGGDRHRVLSEVMSKPDRFIINPYWRAYSVYALVCLVVLSYDIIVMPVMLAWDFQHYFWTEALSIVTLIFWIFDAGLTMNTGVHEGGELVLSRARIIRKYARSWMFLDLSIILVDGTALLLQMKARGSSMIRAVKIMRFVRLVRFVHAAKFSDSLERALGELGGTTELAFALAKPLGVILLINHWLACSWYATGKFLPSDTGHSWLDAVAADNFWYTYTTALHWSLTQMTPGSMQSFPMNTPERLANLLCLLVGMIVFSSLISSMAAQTTEHLRETGGRKRNLRTLSRFLKGNSVDPAVAAAIEKCFLEVVVRKQLKPVVTTDVAALKHLPSSLQRSLRLEISKRQLRPSLFRIWSTVDPTGFASLCVDTVEMCAFAARDVVFSSRGRCRGMYIVTQGRLTYEAPEEPGLQLAVGTPLCEVALWVKWCHLGDAVASVGSVLLTVDAEKFGALALSNRFVGHFALDLGSACVRWAASDPTCLADFMRFSAGSLFRNRNLRRSKTNLFSMQAEAPATSSCLLEVLLPSMTLESRVLAARVAAELDPPPESSVEMLHTGLPGMVSPLETEVLENKAAYMPDDDGSLVRIVSVQVMDIRDENDRTLSRIGSYSNANVDVKVELPGSKQRAGETGPQAIERIIQNKLTSLPQVIWGNTQTNVQVTMQLSKRARCRTKYIKTTHKGRMPEGASLMEAEWHVVETVSKTHTNSSGKWSSRGSRYAPETMTLHPMKQTDGTIGLYTWFEEQELEYYRSAEGENALQSFFDGVWLQLPAFPEPLASEAASHAAASEAAGVALMDPADKEEEQEEGGDLGI